MVQVLRSAHASADAALVATWAQTWGDVQTTSLEEEEGADDASDAPAHSFASFREKMSISSVQSRERDSNRRTRRIAHVMAFAKLAPTFFAHFIGFCTIIGIRIFAIWSCDVWV